MSMTNSIPEVKPWQIRVAHVKFHDKPGKGKRRPVLIVNLSGNSAYCLKITSAGPSDQYPRFELADYEKLGLKKPSWLQLSPAYMVPVTKFGELISQAPIDLVERVNDAIRQLGTPRE